MTTGPAKMTDIDSTVANSGATTPLLPSSRGLSQEQIAVLSPLVALMERARASAGDDGSEFLRTLCGLIDKELAA
ncbi:MAG: hypothetical protein K0R61_748 [Microvirga sp.]|jgi:hypothetical protein|nr:hypothetical protein [Microvirga sp.]